MKKQYFFPKAAAIAAFLFILVPSTEAQIFHWYDDGFFPLDSVYPNVDNSGIDIEIHLTEDYSWAYSPTSTNYNSVKTGINNFQYDSIQHEYTIKFSENVDVEFEIYDINFDTTQAVNKWYDLLIFGEEAIITLYGGTSMSNNVVYPNTDGYGGLHVRYENTDSLTILHGLGEGYNPGFLIITPLIINGNILNVPENPLAVTPELVQTGAHQFILKNLLKEPRQVQVVDLQGKQIPIQENYSNEELLLELGNVPEGMYLIKCVLENGQLFEQKLVVGS